MKDYEILTESELQTLWDAPEDDTCKASVHCVIRELRKRRAHDLTGPEVEEIEWFVRRIKEGAAGINPNANHAALLLSALTKMLVRLESP